MNPSGQGTGFWSLLTWFLYVLVVCKRQEVEVCYDSFKRAEQGTVSRLEHRSFLRVK